MDIQKLILAAHVNEFAQRLKRSARSEFEDSLSLPVDSPEAEAKMGEWEKENRIGKYFGLAYRQLIKTAKVIDETQELMEQEAEQESIAAADEALAPVAAALAADEKFQ